MNLIKRNLGGTSFWFSKTKLRMLLKGVHVSTDAQIRLEAYSNISWKVKGIWKYKAVIKPWASVTIMDSFEQGGYLSDIWKLVLLNKHTCIIWIKFKRLWLNLLKQNVNSQNDVFSCKINVNQCFITENLNDAI